jgi:hypothetical protein
MKKIAIIACGLAASSSFASGGGSAKKQDLRPALQVRAIVGATVQVSPTKVLEGATVLIKGSVIVEVGTNVKVPAGAEVTDGKGLTVYAGFVDAWTTKGQLAPGERPRQDTPPDTGVDVVTQMRIGAATNRADLLGGDLFNPDDDAWKAERTAGFTAALVTPSNGVVLGQPSLVEIDGRPRRNSTLVASTGIAIRFRGGFGGFGGGRSYPVTPLGYFATARQAMFDAQHQVALSQAHLAGNPHRPDDDPALSALTKRIPFLLQATTVGDIDRTLDFGAEFSRPTYLLGATEAYKITAKLKSGAKGAIVTLDFGPEPMPATRPTGDDPFAFPGAVTSSSESSVGHVEAEAGAGAGGQAPAARPQGQGQGQGRPPGQAPGGGGRRRGPTVDPDEPEGKKKENEALWLEKVGNAAALEKAGVLFALSTEGVANPEEFFTNLRRAVKQGLSKAGAISALTTAPAEIFGVRHILGTVETGKLANLTVLTSDLFKDGVKVKYLFIDGAKIDPAKAAVDFTPAPRFGEDE